MSIKGFGSYNNGKHHPVHERKGITEDQLDVSVKGNNDTIIVDKPRKMTKRDEAIREISDAQTLEDLSFNRRFSQKNRERFAESAKQHRQNADRLIEEMIKENN